MDIQKEVEKIMIDGIEKYAKHQHVSTDNITLLLGLSSFTKSTVLVKKYNDIIGKVKLQDLLGFRAIFYTQINEYITKALMKFSADESIAHDNVYIAISMDNNKNVSLSLQNGFSTVVKKIEVDDIVKK